jgi:hypothetical protein
MGRTELMDQIIWGPGDDPNDESRKKDPGLADMYKTIDAELNVYRPERYTTDDWQQPIVDHVKEQLHAEDIERVISRYAAEIVHRREGELKKTTRRSLRDQHQLALGGDAVQIREFLRDIHHLPVDVGGNEVVRLGAMSLADISARRTSAEQSLKEKINAHDEEMSVWDVLYEMLKQNKSATLNDLL